MIPGRDYIGVGVGAMVFNAQGEVFLSQRGPNSRNERGSWEFPGGRVEFGESLKEAVAREFLEEYGMVIAVDDLLGLDDHILPDEGQLSLPPLFCVSHSSLSCVDGPDPRLDGARFGLGACITAHGAGVPDDFALPLFQL